MISSDGKKIPFIRPLAEKNNAELPRQVVHESIGKIDDFKQISNSLFLLQDNN